MQSSTFEAALRDRDLPGIHDVNPWLSSLEQEVGECKIPGNFLSTYSPLCNEIADIGDFANEAYSLHLMKAITSTFTAVRNIAFKHGWDSLLNPEQINSWYDEFLDVEIPDTLEGDAKNHMPFTQKETDANKYGNGRVGYTIYNINGEPKYGQVLSTGYDYSDTLGDFTAVVEFYKANRFVRYIKSVSTRDRCLDLVTTTAVTATTPSLSAVTAPSNEGSSGGTIAAIFFGVAFGISVAVVAGWKLYSKYLECIKFHTCLYSASLLQFDSVTRQYLITIINFLPKKVTFGMLVFSDDLMSSKLFF